MERTFTKEFMQAVLWKDEPLADTVEDIMIENSRWSIHHKLIFKFEDTYWEAFYSVGATEQQDERPWEYVKEVICTEVKPVEKMVIVYEAV